MRRFAVRAKHAFDGDHFLDQGATVLVRDGRIVAVEPAAYDVSADWPVVDHGDATILPGLIETHAHLVTDSSPMALDRVAGYTDDEIDAVVTAALQAQLASGVTAVRDLGDRSFNVVSRRDAQRRADDGLPWIVASGPPLTTRAGHCHYLRGEVHGTDTIRTALSERVERSVDVVKIMASGGMNTPGTDPAAAAFTVGDLRLMVDLAHEASLPVAVHAHAADAIDMAVAIGVETIEHATYVTPRSHSVGDTISAILSQQATDERLEDLAASGALVCPTMGGFTTELFDNGSPVIKQRVAASGMTPEEIVCRRRLLVERMGQAGVRFVGGSDAGIAPLKAHGRYAAAVVELGAIIGVVPSLAASTSTAAHVCGLAAVKGRLRAGFDADLLVVGGDLATDLDLLWHVRQVVLRGRTTSSPVTADCS